MRVGLGWMACSLATALLGCPGTGDPVGGGRDAGTDSGAPGTLVSASVEVDVLLANNFPSQLHPLFRADITAGSALARLQLFARYCTDPACANPIALVPITVDGADANGEYVFVSANTSGDGFAKAVTIPQAPLGSSYLQIIGDSQASRERGLGDCSSLANCPGDFDVLASAGFQVSVNNDGSVDQPASSTVAITVSAAGATVAVPGTVYLGHLVFDRGSLETPAPSDDGTLVMAMSNVADTYRNRIGLVDLSDASAHPGQLASSTYTLQNGGSDYLGDVCGMVRGGGSLYAIGIDNAGASIFRLDGATGLQASTTPVAVIPPTNVNDPLTFPHPCRGVFVDAADDDYLYLVDFAGAGSLGTSSPHPLYQVALSDGSVDYPSIAGSNNLAPRGVAVASNGRVFVVDMSYSVDAVTNANSRLRIASFVADGSGGVSPDPIAFAPVTNRTANEQCDSTAHWPSGAVVADVGGTERLLVGHDTGIAVFDVSTLAEVQNLPLPAHGRLFSQLVVDAANDRVYALPQCKAITANSTFTLPYGASTEASDSNMVAVLDTSAATLAIATTTLDPDGNGTPDHGIDIDFYGVKRFIRDHGSTLPIPPVVYTGPQMAVGGSMLFVRGSGIQGNGSSAISSSGMGQAQDVSFFDLSTGRGIVFGDYTPWLHGLSSMAGTGRAIWGYDATPGREASIGWVEYLP